MAPPPPATTPPRAATSHLPPVVTTPLPTPLPPKRGRGMGQSAHTPATMARGKGWSLELLEAWPGKRHAPSPHTQTLPALGGGREAALPHSPPPTHRAPLLLLTENKEWKWLPVAWVLPGEGGFVGGGDERGASCKAFLAISRDQSEQVGL